MCKACRCDPLPVRHDCSRSGMFHIVGCQFLREMKQTAAASILPVFNSNSQLLSFRQAVLPVIYVWLFICMALFFFFTFLLFCFSFNRTSISTLPFFCERAKVLTCLSDWLHIFEKHNTDRYLPNLSFRKKNPPKNGLRISQNKVVLDFCRRLLHLIYGHYFKAGPKYNQHQNQILTCSRKALLTPSFTFGVTSKSL